MHKYLTLTLLALIATNAHAAEPAKTETPKATVKPLAEVDWLRLKDAARDAQEAEKPYREAVKKQNDAYAAACKASGIEDTPRCAITPPDPGDKEHPFGTVTLKPEPPKPEPKK
jgi:hypothetical protein